MAIASDLKVGQAVRVHGRNAVLESVDSFAMTATVRFEDGETLVVRTEDVSVSTPEQVAGLVAGREAAAEAGLRKADKGVGVRGPLGDRAAVPTRTQITAAREKARVLGNAEGLKGQNLEDVQDEAEAELVARMARGEAPAA